MYRRAIEYSCRIDFLAIFKKKKKIIDILESSRMNELSMET